MNLRIIEDRLRQEYSLPDGFEFWKWKCFPESGGETIYVEFTGGVVPPFKSGPRKGKPNYRNATGNRVFNVTVEQARQWESDYERETGRCRVCRGSGEELKKLNCITGEKVMRVCRRCNGDSDFALGAGVLAVPKEERQ